MSARKPTERQRRVQRVWKRGQRGSLTPGAALVLLAVLGLLTLATVTLGLTMEGINDRTVWVDRCEHQGGEAVMTPGRTLVCVDRRYLLVPK